MDAAIGRLLAGVRAAGQADNTVVVFLSDNGMSHKAEADRELAATDWAKRNVHGLRGHKATVWENGIRVPQALACRMGLGGHMQRAAPGMSFVATCEHSRGGPYGIGRKLLRRELLQTFHHRSICNTTCSQIKLVEGHVSYVDIRRDGWRTPPTAA